MRIIAITLRGSPFKAPMMMRRMIASAFETWRDWLPS
jgi:hypothetical protein